MTTEVPLVGTTLAGRYTLEELVGRGAMGCVYKARQLTLGTTVAIKVLHRHLAGEPMFAARFLREAQAASRVNHPNSMRVIDFGEEPSGLLYIAMEFVAGRSLAQILQAEGPLEVSRIVDMASQALAAISVAHDLGVVHRDLKPENLMILEGEDDEGRAHDVVKVCDFGVAKLLERDTAEASMTVEGLVLGTPEYMSPEQAKGEAFDARSDIYSMGVLLFHMMTGRVPFDSTSAFGTALMHVKDEPTRPRLLNPRVDSRLENICLKAMQKRPEDRYASARELRTALRAILDSDDPDVFAQRSTSDAPVSMARDKAPLSGGLVQQMATAKPRRAGLISASLALAASTVLASLWLVGSGRRHSDSDTNRPETQAKSVQERPGDRIAAPPQAAGAQGALPPSISESPSMPTAATGAAPVSPENSAKVPEVLHHGAAAGVGAAKGNARHLGSSAPLKKRIPGDVLPAGSAPSVTPLPSANPAAPVASGRTAPVASGRTAPVANLLALPKPAATNESASNPALDEPLPTFPVPRAEPAPTP